MIKKRNRITCEAAGDKQFNCLQILLHSGWSIIICIQCVKFGLYFATGKSGKNVFHIFIHVVLDSENH